jgi:NAD(P)-dependent dehydrogenase (short-subunit alcohol dehydrogenase family)
MMQLAGKTALVTGGSAGIGLATAQRFVDEGAHVFVTGRRADVLQRAVAPLGSAATAVVCDATDLEDVHRLFEQVTRRGSGLDVLFANVGLAAMQPLAAMTAEHYATVVAANMTATVHTVHGALDSLNSGASVILAGSSSATSGTPGFSVYAATKAAVRSFSRTWAAELAGRGIRVNTLVPGPTRTPGSEDLMPDHVDIDATMRRFAESIPLGRLGDPADIANAAVPRLRAERIHDRRGAARRRRCRAGLRAQTRPVGGDRTRTSSSASSAQTSPASTTSRA